MRFWRPRRNPLRRSTDRTEAWVVLGTGLLLSIGAPAAGPGSMARLKGADRP